MPEEQTTPVVVPPVSDPAPVVPPAEAKNTDTTPQEPTIPYARFKEVVDKLKTLEDEKKAEQARQEAQSEADKVNNQQFETLANERKAKIDELKPKAELADELATLLEAVYLESIKDWPESVKAMAPEESADIRAKLRWQKSAAKLASELMEEKTPIPGSGRRPVPISAAGKAKASEDARQNQENWTRNRI